MAKTRPSPTENDKIRIMEAIRSLDTFDRIKDYGSFIEAYDDYMEGSALKNDTSFKDDVFEGYIKAYEGVADTRNVPKKERQKEVQQYERKGKIGILEHEGVLKKPKRELNFPTVRRGKVVYAEKTFVIVKGKRQDRFRDSWGRFTSGKIKK
jgi:hypothetical protein